MTGGTDTSNAGTALITNNFHGATNFLAHSSASGATIVNHSGGRTDFRDQSMAGNATIVNNSGGVTAFGTPLGGTDTASAGNATITNHGGAAIGFYAAATAGNASIINEAGGVVQFGDPGFANDNATAGNSTITNSGGIVFNSKTTAGSATITTMLGGNVSFSDTSSGGAARFVTNAGGTFDISGLTSAGTTAGSIEGAGSYVLGAKNLATGSNDLSTTVSGTISGNGGSLTKVGAGTLILSGTNTYSGGTTISGGTLQLGDGLITGSITGNVVNNGILAVNRSNAYVFFGAISGNGAFQQIGTGTTTLNSANTYVGPTTVSAGTLAISGIGSITSNVTNHANFDNAGAVTGAVTNNGTALNSGTISNGLTNNGTTANTGTIDGGLINAAGTTTNFGTINGGLSNNATTTNNGTINGGLINNGTTTNAGTISGGLTNAAGTTTNSGTIGGGLTNSAIVNATGGAINGAIVNNAGGTFNVAGTVSSDSTFSNAATATLAVGANGSYTLQGLLTNSGAVTVANGGQLVATAGGITNNAGGTIAVAAGGTVVDDLNNAGAVANAGAYLANVATNAGTIANTGVWTGNVASNAGTITNDQTWTGNVASNTGTITNSLSWNGGISNAGTFVNEAGATVTGLLTNTAGTTTNDGTLAGGAIVSGGILTGTGVVAGGLTVASGGTFNPGNGTPGSSMALTGNLAFQSGAIYMVQIDPATSSQTVVSGTATLGGATVNAVFAPGNYVARQYTILTADGGVSGTFAPNSVNTNLAPNFRTELSYDTNHAYLKLNLDFSLAGGLNGNQQAVGNALTNFFNSTGGIPAAFASLDAAGLTAASGELGTGIIQSAIKADDLFLNLLLDPALAGRAGGFASGGTAVPFADDETLAYAGKRHATPSERAAFAMARKAPALLAAQPASRWSIWGSAYGGSANTQGNAAAGTQDTAARLYGVAAGADYRVTPDTLIGFALAGGGTNYALANAMGHGSSDLFQAGAFGRHNFGPAYLSAALAYGWHDVTTNRTVALAGVDRLQARFRAETFSGRFEAGYRHANPVVALTPYAAAQVTSFGLPDYAEQSLAGGGLFALNYAAQTVTATRTELGLRSDKSIAMQNAVLTLRGRAAWAHDYNADRAVTAVFQALPGASFVVNGAKGHADAALLSAGAEIKWLNGFSLMGTFEGEFSGNVSSYAGKGVARYAW